jgi:acetyltransferase EpsM
MKKNNPFILIGASGHGKVIAEILEVSGEKIHSFFDQDLSKKELLSYPVYHSLDQLDPNEYQWLVSVGMNQTRRKIVEQNSFQYGTAIHPGTHLSKRIAIGVGTVIMAGVCINSGTVVGKHVIVNTSASVDHDCMLEDYVHVSPGAILTGNVHVGEGTHIGAGATVIPGIRIGKWCTIGAGSVIIRDVPDGAKVVGVPGKQVVSF